MTTSVPTSSGGGPSRVLVVDDETAIRDALENALTFEGYQVEQAADGFLALQQVELWRPDLVLLDVMMPRLDGLTACRRLRARGDTVPVLMLTARDAVGDRVTGLDVGADDYLVKPFELDELLARVRALLRRNALTAGTGATSGAAEQVTLAFADLRLDRITREVFRADRQIRLTPTEFALLELLLAHPRQVLPRERILREVWGPDHEPVSNTLELYVMYLRRKTEAGGEPRLIHTERGVGYALRLVNRG